MPKADKRATGAARMAQPGTVERLLSRGGEIADGRNAWVDPNLRSAFLSRVNSGEDPLGDHYSLIFSAEERRSKGATLTPRAVVDGMISWAGRQAKLLGRPARVVDPGAGTGRFSLAAANAFPDAQIVAVENDPHLILLLKANLRAAGWLRRVAIIEQDFRDVALPLIPEPTLFIGNPPYVRHHEISRDWKRWYSKLCEGHGVKASQLAGLHLHFFAKVAELGKEGDYGCFITAAEWLDVGYGSALKSLLANSLGGAEIHLLEPTAEVFPGTMTTAAITGFRIGRRPQQLYIRRTSAVGNLDRSSGGRSVDWSQIDSKSKWSLLVYPDRRPAPGEIELGEICRVHRGQVTGNNGIWIAGAAATALPRRFLKPTVTRANELIAAEPTLLDYQHLARVVDLPPTLHDVPEMEQEAIDRFLAWAKDRGAADGYIARHRNPWWAVRLREPAPIICTYMARRAPAFVRNLTGAHLLNIAHGIYPREELTEEQLQKLLIALRRNAKREHGRTYAGGLTKFEPREIERLRIPRLEALDAGG